MPPAGTQLPTALALLRVPSFSNLICGTQGTGWMKGQHPSHTNRIVTRKACFAWDEQECFHLTQGVDIKVSACNDPSGELFYVYQLPKPPSCNWAYCSTISGTYILHAGTNYMFLVFIHSNAL